MRLCDNCGHCEQAHNKQMGVCLEPIVKCPCECFVTSEYAPVELHTEKESTLFSLIGQLQALPEEDRETILAVLVVFFKTPKEPAS